MLAIDTMLTARRGHSGGGATFLRRISFAARSLLGGLLQVMERRRTRLALFELTDDQLKDIGISRADAYREGLRPFWE